MLLSYFSVRRKHGRPAGAAAVQGAVPTPGEVQAAEAVAAAAAGSADAAAGSADAAAENRTGETPEDGCQTAGDPVGRDRQNGVWLVVDEI